ncbi:dTDP-glucose 4,6-dehydratase [Salirhabdus sp. Marseille-P4669]|uniref:dTDP-glucose 4,6-dehydratase n=1 Tax=Salirhabdus sp. Marseille-P4669 TaxID=2042310 RepID=UPI00190E7169|nr:dTDP-glucose 4,6-dehydratase [Salirhabdus sp. Marseille-P4669]
MNILITGGAGFIGSNFIRYMVKKYNYRIINIDLLTYAGNYNNLKDIENNNNYTFIKGDICDKNLICKVFDLYEIDTVINFAAESHVDRSILNPGLFLKSNVLGTQTLLDVAYEKWHIKNNNLQYKNGVKFIQISTDEVYGTLGKSGYFTENTCLAPNSPYSASKASADMFVRAYHSTYGLPINITRCSNNYGPYQYPEKFIPLMIQRALKDVPLPIYGDGKQIRDWLHVEDHCSAIDTVLHKGRVGEVYNIGGNNEIENIELAKIILKYLNKDEELITFVEDRLGHDRRYAIDNSKITNELGWTPSYTFQEGIKNTINWYKKL